jgi:ribosomal-protein-alanine N-acetyltransferase
MPDATITIMPMTVSDIPAILEIERNSHIQPWHDGSFREELNRPHSHNYVACSPDAAHLRQILGYVCFWLIADEVQILNLAVHMAHRRRGIGKSLLLHALRVGCEHNARVAVLEMRRSNSAAHSLYQGLGFRPVGERKDYYGGLLEPAVLMELEMDWAWCSRWMPT